VELAMSTVVQTTAIRSGEARRALVLHDRPLVVDLIELTLNHGVFLVRPASNLAEAEAILDDWQPHLAVIDMDRRQHRAPGAAGRGQPADEARHPRPRVDASR
jgi:hypothetical protein